jgi:hypothetical protein
LLQLRDHFADLSKSTHGFFADRVGLAHILDDHLAKRGNHTQEIDTILTIAMTRKKLLEDDSFVIGKTGG